MGRSQRTIRVLFHQDAEGETNLWVARCLEHDISAQGKTLKDAADALSCLVERRFQLYEQFGHSSPFEGIPQAPPDVWQRFDEAFDLVGREQGSSTPMFDLPIQVPAVRIFA